MKRRNTPSEEVARNEMGGINAYTVLTCAVASAGALLFGLDVGITGGVTSDPNFLQIFFPAIAEQMDANTSENAYCSFNSQTLSLFTSSFFLAGMVSSVPASWLSATRGRKSSMAVGASLYVLGSALNAGARRTPMLLVGRIVLGLGCGFVNQSVPTFLSEISPPEHRGVLQTFFQIFVNLGILIAGIVNYYVLPLDYGFRISLGVFIPPALVLLGGCTLLPETPAFLCSADRDEDALNALRKLRGKDADVQEEYEAIRKGTDELKSHGTTLQQLRLILSLPYRGELVVAVFVALFSQLTGINSMLYYAPELFSILSSNENISLISAVVTASVFLAGALTSLTVIDRKGRRKLLLAGGSAMFVLQVVTAVLLAVEFDPFDVEAAPSWFPPVLLAVISLFVYCFGWSWGPLGWLVPVESQSQRTRSAAATMSVLSNFFAVFLTTQLFLPMLCKLEWGTFLFFAGFDVVMTAFVKYLVVETKGVDMDEMHEQYAAHPFWRRYAQHSSPEHGCGAGGVEEPLLPAHELSEDEPG